MTKEEWKQAEEKLNSAFGRVDLLVDGYAITNWNGGTVMPWRGA